VNIDWVCAWCEGIVRDEEIALVNSTVYHRGQCVEEKLAAALSGGHPCPDEVPAEGYTIRDLFDNERTAAQAAAAERVIEAARMVAFGMVGDVRPEVLALYHAVQALDAVTALDEVPA